jgi:hypothetical protein
MTALRLLTSNGKDKKTLQLVGKLHLEQWPIKEGKGRYTGNTTKPEIKDFLMNPVYGFTGVARGKKNLYRATNCSRAIQQHEIMSGKEQCNNAKNSEETEDGGTTKTPEHIGNGG